ncbi:MAG TPA: P-II family nitrogen regulator, partial [Clostridiaceae bacterium]|nr:P-II family nitrogen regulator [Clostridiaceae bacterium]
MINETLFFVVVNRGKADEVLSEMQSFGLAGGVILHGDGTSVNKILKILGLDETHKDIIIMPIPEELEDPLHEMVAQVFSLTKRNRGIAFSVPMSRYRSQKIFPDHMRCDRTSFRHHCIFTILDRGKSRDCVQFAREAGAPGGTIMHGHGAGKSLVDAAFPLFIEPEKDIVMQIAPTE